MRGSPNLLALLLFCCLLSPAAHTAEETRSFLLLNNNTIINGIVLNFNGGFLFFKENRRIIRISPLHFIGIFDTEDNAENAIIVLNEPSDTTNISEMQPIFDCIYRKAAVFTTRHQSREEILSSFTSLRKKADNPHSLLEIQLYKEVLLFSALSRHYRLQDEFIDFLDTIRSWKKSAKTEKANFNNIEIKLKAIEYLYENPYISQ